MSYGDGDIDTLGCGTIYSQNSDDLLFCLHLFVLLWSFGFHSSTTVSLYLVQLLSLLVGVWFHVLIKMISLKKR